MFHKKIYIVLLLVSAACFAETEDKSNKDKADYIAKVFGASGASVKPSAQSDAEQKGDQKPRNSVLLKAAVIGGAVFVGAMILYITLRRLRSRREAEILEGYGGAVYSRPGDGRTHIITRR